MKASFWFWGMVALGATAQADIVLRSTTNNVNVVFEDTKKVYFRKCLEPVPKNGSWRNCLSEKGSQFPRDRHQYFLSALRLKKIQEAFLVQDPLNALVIAIEDRGRTASDGDSPASLEYLKNLKTMRDKVMDVTENWLPYLAAGNDRTWVEDIDEEYPEVIFAFSELWSDGHGKVWRVTEPARWVDQEEECGKFWKTTSMKDIMGDENFEPRAAMASSRLMASFAKPVAWTTSDSTVLGNMVAGGSSSNYGAGVSLGMVSPPSRGAKFLWSSRGNGEEGAWEDAVNGRIGPPISKLRYFYTVPGYHFPIVCWR